MKTWIKALLFFIIIAIALVGGWFLGYHADKSIEPKMQDDAKTVYINVEDLNSSALFNEAKELSLALKQIGVSNVLSPMGGFKTGNYNLYFAQNMQNLPEISDKNAINILYIPTILENEEAIGLRPFDVIVVKSPGAFGHLRAINVRTAYIPRAINIKQEPLEKPQGKIMFAEDNAEFILPLFLAKKYHFIVDVFGKGYDKNNHAFSLKNDRANINDYKNYAVTLINSHNTSPERDFADENALNAIENGGLPYIPYTNSLNQIFGQNIPMYSNDDEFKNILNYLLQNPQKVFEMKRSLQEIAKQYDSISQAHKFFELFEIMEQKRR